MQTVHLKGELGERFGEKWSMNVNKVQDIFRLIECQRQGFRPYIQECIENEIDFTIQRGEEFIDETELLLSLGKEDIIVLSTSICFIEALRSIGTQHKHTGIHIRDILDTLRLYEPKS